MIAVVSVILKPIIYLILWYFYFLNLQVYEVFLLDPFLQYSALKAICSLMQGDNVWRYTDKLPLH